MTARFVPGRPHIPVRGYISGPVADHYIWFALDTAATRTVVRPRFLRLIGCDLGNPLKRVEMTAATGTSIAPVVNLRELVALGQRRENVSVVAHELPDTFVGEGLLGLDFFQKFVLTVDFVDGVIALDRKKPTRRRWWFG